jgi:hypothetical protein
VLPIAARFSGRSPSLRRSLILQLLGAMLWSAAPVAAQDPIGPSPFPEPTPRWVGHFTVFSANALLSGVTAGITRKVRGGSFSEGFARGVVGGGTVYAGEVIAVQRWDGAGLVGREVAAVGASVVRNAGEGRGALERVSLPLGPVRLHLGTGAGGGVRATVDLHTLFWIGYGLVEPALHFDAGASLSAGAPVFRTRDQMMIWRRSGNMMSGVAPAGAIFLADVPHQDADFRSYVFAHERVHTLQYDQLSHTVGDPLEKWLLGRFAAGRALSRFVDVNLLLWIAAAPGSEALVFEQRPWEMEAHFLAEP